MLNTKLIAHRGIFNNNDVAENTIGSFKRAINKNIDFELDVQLTKDNKLVVFHDDNLVRLAGNNLIVQECVYDDLKNIKLLDTDSTIPLLSDVLKLNNDRVLIDIEIKNTKRIKETVNTLMRELDQYHNFIIKSFNPIIVRYLKKNYPNITCGLLINKKYDSMLYNFILHTKYIILYSKCDFVAISKKLLKDKAYLEKIKGFDTLVWTVEDGDILSDKYIPIKNIKI